MGNLFDILVNISPSPLYVGNPARGVNRMVHTRGGGEGFTLPFGPAFRPETQCRRKRFTLKEMGGEVLSVGSGYLTLNQKWRAKSLEQILKKHLLEPARYNF